MLVIDASAAIDACSGPYGFQPFGSEDLFAPALLWSETRSVIHEALWRGQVSANQALRTLGTLGGGRIQLRSHTRLGETAWQIADQLGWAKTYDVEYVALAQLLGCRLVTLDARLRRGTARLGFVVGPDEI